MNPFSSANRADNANHGEQDDNGEATVVVSPVRRLACASGTMRTTPMLERAAHHAERDVYSKAIARRHDSGQVDVARAGRWGRCQRSKARRITRSVSTCLARWSASGPRFV
jgi:hypothetical protein